MDVKRIVFLMGVQEKIDILERNKSLNDITINGLKERFYRLSQKELKIEQDFTTEKLNIISSDIKVLRKILSIDGEVSINFDFIQNERVRKQLVIDNLRMENIRLNLVMSDFERFHEFCINAFYQIEELINYFYWKKFEAQAIINLLDFIDDKHSQRNIEEDNKVKPYKIYFRKDETKQTDISKIDIHNKLTAFMYYFRFSVEQNILVNNIRQVRNESSHRCSVIGGNSEERLYKFVNNRDDNYGKIRHLIRDICMLIKNEL